MLTGGGSGGHITPLLAVAHELKQRQPDLKLVYIGQKGEKLEAVVQGNPDIDEATFVWAGKWRRYHGEGWRQLFDIVTLFKNIRDFTRVIRGTWQSYRLLGRYKPVGIFIRGGFVGVPVGLAAHWRQIPFVTHDSDALPSLANRIIGRWAAAHAVAMPVDMYPYPPAKTHYVGVPINANYQPVTLELKQQYMHQLGFDGFKHIILVTGGGMGAQRINEAIVGIAPALLQTYPSLAIIHATGPDHEKVISSAYGAVLAPADQQRVLVKGFLDEFYRYSGAADVVVTRAGATNLAEWAAQGKACIVIPNPLLTGGHQLKNTQALAKQHAIIEIDEPQLKDKKVLQAAIQQLLDHPEQRVQLEINISQFAKLNAAAELAELLIQTFGLTGRAVTERS